MTDPDLAEQTVPPPAPVYTGEKLSGRVATFSDQFEIFFDHPMGAYGTPYTKFYPGRSTRGGAVFACVCDRAAMPRLQAAEKSVNFQSPALARVIARGVVPYPDGQERYTFIYDAGMGAPIVPDGGAAGAYGWKPDVVISAVLKPVIAALQELHNADMAHGAIRLGNLFDGGVLPLQRVVIGDFLGCNYLSAQPLIYMPPTLWPALPMGRGLGNPAHDLYALGVVCAILLRTHDPMKGKTDEDIFLNKLDLGSLSTFIENERLPSNVMELLRGLLHDDPVVRWNIVDVNDWMEGKRTAHRQGSRKLKASRHLVLDGQKILLPSEYGYFAAKNVPAAIKQIENGDVKQWIRRSISDARLDHRYDEAVGDGGAEDKSGISSPDRTVARMVMVMEPNYPILYRGVGVYPESFGPVLAEMVMSGQDVRPMIDILSDQSIPFWMNSQDDVPADLNHVINKFEMCQQFLKQRSIGYGVERCVYFLVSDIQCLSPVFKNFAIYSPEALLYALNAVADMPDRPTRILDRHMVAFLSVRDRRLVDRYLPDLGAEDYHRMMSGTLSILSAVQSIGKMPPLIPLARWVHGMITPLYERFHDRDTRVSVAKKMDELKDQGYIHKMADLILDPESIRRDLYDYRLATQEYYALRQEKRYLTEQLKHQNRFGTQAGRDAAALFAGVIMALGVAGFVLMRFSQGGMPW
jgi:hypothetical protein